MTPSQVRVVISKAPSVTVVDHAAYNDFSMPMSLF